MSGQFKGLLDILDLLAEGQRRQAEIITGVRFEAPAGIKPVQAAKLIKFPFARDQKRHLFGLPDEPRAHTRQ